MLKQVVEIDNKIYAIAATFGWLCVETPPTTLQLLVLPAATFGWLCVETADFLRNNNKDDSSHLRVAVC